MSNNFDRISETPPPVSERRKARNERTPQIVALLDATSERIRREGLPTSRPYEQYRNERLSRR